MRSLEGQRVLVTGGTGFIGGHLVGRLVSDQRAVVRVLVRDFSRAPLVGRFPVELVGGDVTNADDVMRAADGCNIIFHCAYGNHGADHDRRATNVAGAHNVVNAAVARGVRRLVHVSTVSVYGDFRGPELNERAPREFTGAPYGDSKLAAERLVLQARAEQGLEAVVVQPTIVYGPFGSTWTRNVIEQLRSSRVIAVNGGTGTCNAVYVDDVVTALVLAATVKGAAGEPYLITGADYPTWRTFYETFERMLNVHDRVTSLPLEAVLALHEQRARAKRLKGELIALLRDPSVRERLLSTPEGRFLLRTAKRLAPDALWRLLKTRLAASGPAPAGRPALPLAPLDPAKARMMAAPTRVRIDNATQRLGYRPRFTFDEGMRLTQAWARWANLLPA